METLYIRPAGSNGPWEAMEESESQDPDSVEAVVFDLWDEGIREMSLGLIDYDISDSNEGPSPKERLRVMYQDLSKVEAAIIKPDYRGKTRKEITDARYRYADTMQLVDAAKVAIMKLAKKLEEV